MGFPMIQVFLIAARQVSKPIADAVIRYGKDHPVFRNKLLIPVGRGIVRFTARLRMKRLGLGEPTSQISVSESAALEQASDFVQQLVLFSYSVGVFAGYYFYTKVTSPESVKAEEFEQYKEQQEQLIKGLRFQIESLEQRVNAQSKRSFLSQLGVTRDDGPPPPPTASTSSEQPKQKEAEESNKPKENRSRFGMISSLPIDSAISLILDGYLHAAYFSTLSHRFCPADDEYLVVRRGDSLGIELTSKWIARGERLRFRPPDKVRELSSLEIHLREATRHVIGA